MAASYALPAPHSLDLSSGNLERNWIKFCQNYDNFEIATGVSEKSDEARVATLLSVIGQPAVELYNTFQWATAGDDKKYDPVKEQFKSFCKGKKNVHYERHLFLERCQREGETIEAFITALRTLAETCEFDIKPSPKESMIITRIALGVRDPKMKTKLLNTTDLTVDKAVNCVRVHVATTEQVAHLNRYDTNVNAVSRRPEQRQYQAKQHRQKDREKSHTSKQTHSTSSSTCYLCGYSYPHRGTCPATGQICNACGKTGHFAQVCRSSQKDKQPRPTSKQGTHKPDHKHAHALQDDEELEEEDDEESEEEYCYAISGNSKRKNRPKADIKICDTTVKMLIDTGSDLNVINFDTYKKIRNKPTLRKQETKVYPYGSQEPLDLMGTFETHIAYKQTTITAPVSVSRHGAEQLLGFDTATQLGLVQITYTLNTEMTSDDIFSRFEDRFQGIGKLDTPCKLHIDQSVPSVAQRHRRIPFHFRRKVKEELDRLKSLDIIEPVNDEPTPWVSPITVVSKPKKPDEIRICVDMRAANKAVIRERHITPTMDDILSQLNGAVMFSKLDFNSAYHQIELATESRYITTFSTHEGLFRYKRLNFGVCSAAEKFQNIIQSVLAGLKGVINVSDDILIFGRTETEHMDNLVACLERIRQKNLTIRREKCQFFKRQTEFFGHIFNANGISPDPKKVDSIVNAPEPTSKEAVRSFLGMATYCGRFIQNLATISEPLRDLTKTSSKWKWEEKHKKALNQVKDNISKQCTMAYFNREHQTEVVVDACPVGLGAILVQYDTEGNRSVVALASRSLTPVEQRYSQIEREALGVTWGIHHFHIYLAGSSFSVVTDHKPLLNLFNNPSAKPPMRIERWVMKLQEYEFNLAYKPGKENPADFMSRHPLSSTCSSSREEKIAEEFINLITDNVIPKSMQLTEIETETKTDKTLKLCKWAITHNKWQEARNKTDEIDKQDFESLYKVRTEISVSESHDILLRGQRIIIPKSMRQRAIEIAHEGHQGIVKTKQLLRTKVWFPGIDRLVEQTVSECIPCQASTVEKSVFEPLNMSKLPNQPWEEISIDFKDLPTGEHLLVVIDDYSRYPVVEIVRSTSARCVIPKLDTIFAAYGSPRIVRTDNGPPFNSADFAEFAKYIGFHHRKVTPLWPKANGEVERMMRNLKKVYRTATAAQQNWKQALNQYLRNFRATPHSSIGIAPANALFGREFRTRLPEMPPKPTNDLAIRSKDLKSKAKMKENAEKGSKYRPTKKPIKIGDFALLKRDGTMSTHQTPYHEIPYKVISIKGTMITATDGDRTIARNSSFFKLLRGDNNKLAPPPAVPDLQDMEPVRHMDDPEPVRQIPPARPPPPDPDARIERPQRERKAPVHLQDYIT